LIKEDLWRRWGNRDLTTDLKFTYTNFTRIFIRAESIYQGTNSDNIQLSPNRHTKCPSVETNAIKIYIFL
jgi:phage tail sheath protein FI